MINENNLQEPYLPYKTITKRVPLSEIKFDPQKWLR